MELIRKADVIRVLYENRDYITDITPIRESLEKYQTFEERPKGKWIMDGGVGECSRCHWLITAEI